MSANDTVEAEARLREASQDAARFGLIARGFRERNPNNPDVDLFDRARRALVGVQTRLLSAAGGRSVDVKSAPSSDVVDVGGALPPGSRIRPPDRQRKIDGESRESIHGPAHSGSLRG